MDSLGLKSKILEELLEDMDDRHGMALKPKAAISVTAVKPSVGMEMGHSEPDGDENPLESMGAHGEDDMDDEDLRRLIEQYAK